MPAPKTGVIEIYKILAEREKFELAYLRDLYKEFIRTNLIFASGILIALGLMSKEFGSKIIFFVVLILIICLISIFLNVHFARHFDNILSSFNSWLAALGNLEDSRAFREQAGAHGIAVFSGLRVHYEGKRNVRRGIIARIIGIKYETAQSSGVSGVFYTNQAILFIWAYLFSAVISCAFGAFLFFGKVSDFPI